MIGLVVETTAFALFLGALTSSAIGLRRTLQGRAQERAHHRIATERYLDHVRHLTRESLAKGVPAPTAWRGFRKFYVERKIEEASDIQSVYLRPYDGKPVPGYLPGQHVTLRIRIPDHERPVVRCYSLSDAPDGSGLYRVTVKRLAHPVSNPEVPNGLASSYVHEGLREGHIVELLAPSGNFHVDPQSDDPVVLIAGGVGITPLLSMLNAICAANRNRETWLFYGVRSRRDHAMYFHLKRLQGRFDNLRVVVCYSRPTDTCVQGRDYDFEGHITYDLICSQLDPIGYRFYVCGPAAMQQDLVTNLAASGVPEENIHCESFGIRKSDKIKLDALDGQPSRDMQSSEAADNVIALTSATRSEDGLKVVFARSGKVGHWRPGNANLLELAEKVGVPMEMGCRAGQCGSCAVSLKEGEIDYLVTPAQKPEPGSCLPCVAVPKSGLVLDA